MREPLITYPFPLSDGDVAALCLPRYLTPRDAARLKLMIDALVLTPPTHTLTGMARRPRRHATSHRNRTRFRRRIRRVSQRYRPVTA